MLAGSQEPFVGRAAEMRALAEAFQRASGGTPGIVCIEGPGGIGKTALIRAFLAATAPVMIISASGAEAEMTLPWGVLSQLAAGRAADQSRALRQLAELSQGTDPLASGLVLLDAMAGLASDGPVILVVEDLHWVDQPSAQALRFALRRLSQEHVLAVLTTRPEGPAQSDDGWRRLLADRGQRFRLPGLDPPEVAQLVSVLGGGTLPGPAARRLWLHAGGNPLYVRCLVEELDPGMLAAATGSLPAPGSLATLLVSRLAACGPATQDLVSAAAVLGERCSLALAASVADVPAPAEALGEALAARLLEEHHEGGVRQVQFPHPVVRAAIYAGLSPVRCSALHMAAAQVAAGSVALLHRVAAAAAPDPALAAELAELAEAESAGGRYTSAARCLISAADLSTERRLREDRLLDACTLWLRSGAVHEVSSRRQMLDELTPSPRRDHLRGFLAHLEGRPEEAKRALRAVLDQLRTTGGTDTLAMEAAARLAGLAVYDWDWQTALDLVRDVPATGPGLSLLIRCIGFTMGGRTGEARAALDAARCSTTPGRGGVLECLARGFIEAWSDDLENARCDLEAIAERPGGFGGSLRSAAHWLLADVYYRIGSLDDAIVTAELACSLLQETGRSSSPEIAMAYAVAAYAASARGNWPDAQGHVAAARVQAKPAASNFERAAAAAASWSLAVAMDEPRRMLEAACAFDLAATAPELSLFPFGPVLAEALWRSRRLDEAAAELTGCETQARALGRVSALVGAARVRGLIEGDRQDFPAALRAFEEAAPIAERLPRALESGRFQAAYGFILARLGKRAAAADRTAEARDIFHSIGARPYLDRAEQQLDRLDRGTRRRSGIGELTASETVVARLVASGLSNRQAAERLMVSRKAVEFHLVNIYAKLGVSSRSQLTVKRTTLGL
ncbi:MAG: AAA family ATPase [Streptosporangiales bacterium]